MGTVLERSLGFGSLTQPVGLSQPYHKGGALAELGGYTGDKQQGREGHWRQKGQLVQKQGRGIRSVPC
jgi:hypothetical protein